MAKEPKDEEAGAICSITRAAPAGPQHASNAKRAVRVRILDVQDCSRRHAFVESARTFSCSWLNSAQEPAGQLLCLQETNAGPQGRAGTGPQGRLLERQATPSVCVVAPQVSPLVALAPWESRQRGARALPPSTHTRCPVQGAQTAASAAPATRPAGHHRARGAVHASEVRVQVLLAPQTRQLCCLRCSVARSAGRNAACGARPNAARLPPTRTCDAQAQGRRVGRPSLLRVSSARLSRG